MSERRQLKSKVRKARKPEPSTQRLTMSAKTKSAAPAPAKRRVSFSLSAPDARNVKLAGDFTGWEAWLICLVTVRG